MSQNLGNKIVKWYEGTVLQGNKIGRTFDFPTINLDKPEVMEGEREGVYLCEVIVRERKYFGLLFYGPRLILNEKEKVLEIYLIDFSQDVYGDKITFKLIKYLRGVKIFLDQISFKNQLETDLTKSKEIISNITKSD